MKTHFALSLLLAALAGLAPGPLHALPEGPPIGVDVEVSLAHPLILADKPQTTYLKVGLNARVMNTILLPPQSQVNVAIVLDRSGSMAGAKMENAKLAARRALEQLYPDAIVSVIAFDNEVNVVLPATKLTARDPALHAIDEITSRGGTALFAGVSKAAEELRKFKSLKTVNRIILLSDGAANVGPSTPEELGRLGLSLAKEGITVTTMGLGLDYNEALMARLAQASDGNHAFIAKSSELTEVFREEIGDLARVVAQDMHIQIRCPEGVRPVRVLGREADIRGGTVEVSMNQLRIHPEKYVLLEVELPAGAADTDQLVAEVEVSYRSTGATLPSKVSAPAVARRVASEKDVEESIRTPILVEVAKQIGVERQELAVKLSEEGKKKEAEAIFLENNSTLQKQARIYKAPDLILQGNAQMTLNAGNNAGGATWEIYKKAGQTLSNSISTQNSSSNNTGNLKMLQNSGGLNVPQLSAPEPGPTIMINPKRKLLAIPPESRNTIIVTPPVAK